MGGDQPPGKAGRSLRNRDDLGQTARIDPGTELSKDQEKAIGKESLDSMVKSKALKKVCYR